MATPAPITVPVNIVMNDQEPLTAAQQIRMRTIELLTVFHKDNLVSGRPLTPNMLVRDAKTIEGYIVGED